MKVVRTVVFWCHLAVGALVASVVILMSATGVLLTYQRQMTAWADTRGLDGGAPIAGAARLPIDSLLARVSANGGATATAVTVRSDPDAPVEVSLGRDGRAFVNAYTGAVLGSGSARMRTFFRVVTAWHRTIGATGDRRALGRSIAGLANLGFFFVVLSGLFLWWPRKWTRARLRNIALFRRGASGKAREFNWHNTIGAWSFIPLVAVVGSGVVMSYPWANALVYRAMGDKVPQQQTPRPAGQGNRGGANAGRDQPIRDVRSALTVDVAIALSVAKMPDWRAITIQLPPPSAKTLTAAIDAGNGGQPQLRGSLVIDRATATVARWEPFSSQTPGRRLRSILRFAHTGEVLGVFGQTIAGLVSLGGMLLAYTGVALALRRLFGWRRRRARAGVGAREPSERELETAA